MPTPILVDHLLVVALVVVFPVYGAREYRRLTHRLRAGNPDARAREYRWTMSMQWLLTAGVVTWWTLSGRSAGALGAVVPGGFRMAVGAAVTVLVVAFLYQQWHAVVQIDPAELGGLRAQMEAVADFLPRTPKEAALFRALSVTAGICEEIVYRGYLIWYLAVFVGAWPGALVAGVAFGVLHIYQGAVGAMRTGMVGIVTALLYVLTDSLLWPMILHVAIDLHGGALARHVLRETSSVPEAP